MPPSAAQSRIRGRPPLVLGGSFGRRGSTASQRAWGASVEASMVRHHASLARFCNTLYDCCEWGELPYHPALSWVAHQLWTSIAARRQAADALAGVAPLGAVARLANGA